MLPRRYAGRVLELDHVIAVVDDLDEASARLDRTHGLSSARGGRHVGHGTGNRIVPLGATYLELMAVVDEAEATQSPLGRWVLEIATPGATEPAALCIRTDDIVPIAESLGEEPLAMSRRTPQGTELSWHLAGLDGTLGPDRLPFFIQWHIPPADHPGALELQHRVAVTGMEVTIGDPGPRRHLIDSIPGLTIGPGRGVLSATIHTEDSSIRLD